MSFNDMLLTSNMADKEQAANDLWTAMKPAALYGVDTTLTGGLVLALLGGWFNDVQVDDQSLTLTASSTLYVVANGSTGDISAATGTANWDNGTDYTKLYQVTTGPATVTAVVDRRQVLGGGGGGGGGAVSSVNTQTGAVVLDASDIDIADAGGYFTRTDVEAALQELGAAIAPTAQTFAIQVALSDTSTDLTTGTTKAYVRSPKAFTLSDVRASLGTASSSGAVTVDINQNGTSILSTKLSFDSGETTTTTASTPAVISTTAITDDALLEFDIDAAGTGAKWLIVTMIGI